MAPMNQVEIKNVLGDRASTWHGWGWRPWEGESDLDTVVDEPLEGCEGTDHDDPGSKTGPHS